MTTAIRFYFGGNAEPLLINYDLVVVELSLPAGRGNIVYKDPIKAPRVSDCPLSRN